MNIFDRLNTQFLATFVHCAEALSFTEGAKRAHLTQSAASQQIAKLENQLSVTLFERINKRVFLTHEGRLLLHFAKNLGGSLETFLDGFSKSFAAASGDVHYAMPASCLKTPHFLKILEKRKSWPEINLHVDLLPNEEIEKKLEFGEIDFGFVTKPSHARTILYNLFSAEEYVLVGHPRFRLTTCATTEIPELAFVKYPGFGDLLEIWRQHVLPRRLSFNATHVKCVGSISDLDAAIAMVAHGVGVSVFPKHCVEDLLEKGEIEAHVPAAKGNPQGEIFIVTRADTTQPRRVACVLEGFQQMAPRMSKTRVGRIVT